MFHWATRRGPIAWAIRFWRRYEHHINLFALAAGFIFDLFLTRRPDNPANNLLLIFYLCVAGAAIIILNLRTTRLKENEEVEPLFLLLILQFCFGGLANNLFLIYIRSGTFAASTLFFLILGSMILANEFMRSRYSQLRFNVVIYYLLLLSYLVLALPTFVLHSVGVWQFLLSGLASLAIISGFLALLYYLVFRGRNREQQLVEVSFLVGFVFVLFNILYFLNIIPPVPLSLKAIGVYHEVTHDRGGNFSGTYEKAPWFVFWHDTSTTFHLESGQVAYCFSSVFAPDNLQTPIFHRWEKYNETTGSWDTTSRVPFPISGGRENGFRTFSIKSNITSGRWRCAVETGSGALIGRISFSVVNGSAQALSQKSL